MRRHREEFRRVADRRQWSQLGRASVSTVRRIECDDDDLRCVLASCWSSHSMSCSLGSILASAFQLESLGASRDKLAQLLLEALKIFIWFDLIFSSMDFFLLFLTDVGRILLAWRWGACIKLSLLRKAASRCGGFPCRCPRASSPEIK